MYLSYWFTVDASRLEPKQLEIGIYGDSGCATAHRYAEFDGNEKQFCGSFYEYEGN